MTGGAPVEVRIVGGRHDLAALAAVCPQRYPGLLESVASGTPQARWDILFAFPQESIRLDADGRTRGGDGAVLDGGFLDALDAAWVGQGARVDVDPQWPFRGGWLLYLGYELAGAIEPRLQPRLRPPPAPLPVALALRCPAAILHDHRLDRTVLLAEAGQAALIETMAADLAGHGAWQPVAPRVEAVEEDADAGFLDAVARTHDYLRAGDVFQVNLSRSGACGSPPARPVDVHAALRRANPSPFADSSSMAASPSPVPRRSAWSRCVAARCRPGRLPAPAHACPTTMPRRASANWSITPRNGPSMSC